MNTDGIRIIAGLIISITCMVIWPRIIKLNSFFSLLFSSILFALIVGLPITEIIPVMQTGFGSLLQQIGIVVALGAVLGTVLEKTGALEPISNGILRAFGTGKSVLAVSMLGALVGIPVFCDSGFIILSRIIPSLAAKASIGQGPLTLGLASGLYTTHVLVPPTPGPLAAAATLGIGHELGMVILIGLAGSLPVVLVSYAYAKKMGSKIISPVNHPAVATTTNAMSSFRAVLPLILPILLIALGSFSRQIGGDGVLTKILLIAGTPIIALLMGVLLALTLIDRTLHKDWPQWITQALQDAGLIILITGAGGAFGAVIKASGIDQLISGYASGSEIQGIFFLCFAWIISAIIKSAQGSSTSAMIITSALMAPLAATAGFTSSAGLSILVLAIGGGAFTVSHANDSYFWVVTQFSGITPQEGFSYYTPMTFIQGLTALAASILLFYIL